MGRPGTRGPAERTPAMINIIIFSKDRACQLDLLLNSMKRFFREWREQHVSVLYACSGEGYRSGYEKVMRLHPEFHYARETAFKEDVVRLFQDFRRPFTSFLVDDDMFIDDLTLESPEFRTFASKPRILCLSCRMCPRLDYFYVKNLDVPPPRFKRDRRWRWKGLRGDWGYPMSVSGLHVFRTEDLARPILESGYWNPNTFEGRALMPNPPRRPFMICFEEAKVFCVAVNKVQTVNQNRHSNSYPVEELNSRFLDGRRLSCANNHRVRMRSAHGEVAYEWMETAAEPARRQSPDPAA